MAFAASPSFLCCLCSSTSEASLLNRNFAQIFSSHSFDLVQSLAEFVSVCSVAVIPLLFVFVDE
ncbi:hypothetical protein COLO4_27417 [Corchorus olitorius]|uniref:Uncharacterized protein n=1 Tax=Corchorus olitorius TaxID=93759 RepID=A0A1R3HR53_9ROSI|nr:hypothetical protein COLO4_27417 [Corchorus olitorius]